MKLLSLITAAMFSLTATAATAAVEVGKLAPDFTAKSSTGKDVKLSDYKGKIVVLEWTNPGCPFVKKFYNVGAMQKQQADAVAKDVVWLTINSSAEGKQGNVDAKAANEYIVETKSAQTAYLLDAEGTLGTLYGAKTTPHMYVIDKKGVLAYAGAIDSIKTTSSKDIDKATNYVSAAIESLIAGTPIAVASTQAYGCNVKYK